VVTDDVQLLGRLVAFAALIAATIEYAEILARRELERRRRGELAAVQEAGLRGLVRLTLMDGR
jgi:hypothetical protein